MSAHSETWVCKFGPKSIVLNFLLCLSLMASRSSKSCPEPTSESISKTMLSDSRGFRVTFIFTFNCFRHFVNIVNFRLHYHWTIMVIVDNWAIEFLGIVVNMNNFCDSNSEYLDLHCQCYLFWSCILSSMVPVFDSFESPMFMIVYCLFDVSAVSNTTAMYIIKGRVTIVLFIYLSQHVQCVWQCLYHSMDPIFFCNRCVRAIQYLNYAINSFLYGLIFGESFVIVFNYCCTNINGWDRWKIQVCLIIRVEDCQLSSSSHCNFFSNINQD